MPRDAGGVAAAGRAGEVQQGGPARWRLINPSNGAEVRNILTNNGGASISPIRDPAAISILSWKPQIQSLDSNEGWSGTQFTAVVSNLDIPGVTIGVDVCGTPLIQDAADGFHLAGTDTLVLPSWLPLPPQALEKRRRNAQQNPDPH